MCSGLVVFECVGCGRMKREKSIVRRVSGNGVQSKGRKRNTVSSIGRKTKPRIHRRASFPEYHIVASLLLKLQKKKRNTSSNYYKLWPIYSFLKKTSPFYRLYALNQYVCSLFLSSFSLVFYISMFLCFLPIPVFCHMS